MKTKLIKNFKAGIFTILPVIAFMFVLNWAIKLLFGLVEYVLKIFPQNMFVNYNNIVVDVISIAVIVVLTILIGYFINHYYVGEKIKYLLRPWIKRIPLLNSLFRISKQIREGLDKKGSFQKVVLVTFPTNDVFSVGFVTGDNLEVFNLASNNELVSVFIPTTPNPTNGFLILTKKSLLIEVDYPVSLATSFIISMGTTGATQEIFKSYLEQR